MSRVSSKLDSKIILSLHPVLYPELFCIAVTKEHIRGVKNHRRVVSAKKVATTAKIGFVTMNYIFERSPSKYRPVDLQKTVSENDR